MGPTFSNISPKIDVVYKDTFTFYTSATDDMSGVDPITIILKVNNKSSRIGYRIDHVEQGLYHVSIEAKDHEKSSAIPSIEK